MLPKTARVILTPKCNKACHYCCNEKPSSDFHSAIQLQDTYELAQFSGMVITGGEPMLYWRNIIALAQGARKANSSMRIYLQTAQFTKHTKDVLEYVDGITFTIHEEATEKDGTELCKFQALITQFPGKSFRLNVHVNCKTAVAIMPNLWKEVRFFHHKDDCPIPINEVLFKL